MRTAILSAIRQNAQGDLCALLPYLGRSVLAHQFDLALELGAQRVICLASAQAAEILALQHEAERLEVDFHCVSNHMAMIGLLAADHDIILIEDSVLIDPEAIPEGLQSARGVLTLPVDQGDQAGFERINAELSWAGILTVKADIAAKLADLPAESDPISLLLRLALQARVPQISAQAASIKAGGLVKVSDPVGLQAREDRTFKAALVKGSWSGPFTRLISEITGKLGVSALDLGPKLAFGGAIAACLGGAALAGLLKTPWAFAPLMLAAICAAFLGVFSNIQAHITQSESGRKPFIIGVLLHISLIASAMLLMWGAHDYAALGLPAMTLAAIRVAQSTAERLSHVHWRAFWADRTLLALTMLAGGVIGLWPETLTALTAAALAYLLFFGGNLPLRRA